MICRSTAEAERKGCRMNYMIAAHTDVGIRKNTNQDAYLVKVAQTGLGKICLAVVCDGMGGLSKGEEASATVILAFDRWFAQDLPRLLARGFSADELKLQWDNMTLEMNQKLKTYAGRSGTWMGTTLLAFLILGGDYYIMNVGDSRAYLLTDQLYQLTKDQTYVQAEFDLGHMTYQETLNHPQRNVLLQCVGASDTVNPDFYIGEVQPDQVYLLCSDGFRHVISPQEIYDSFAPGVMRDERIMREQAVKMVELNKSRKENDNISVVLIRTCQEG